jgi:hypothetical protein
MGISLMDGKRRYDQGKVMIDYIAFTVSSNNSRASSPPP